MLNTIKRWASYIPGVRVNKGFGVSTDASISVSKEIAEKPISKPKSKISIKYKLADDVGVFELDSQIRDASGKIKYRIRHVETGMFVVVPDTVFTLLFKSVPRDNNE